jgi:hypothetical protein
LGADRKENFVNESLTIYRATNAETMELNIFTPSVQPSSGSAERSGWGIMPTTFLPALQIPAMLSKEPLGLAEAEISPEGRQ